MKFFKKYGPRRIDRNRAKKEFYGQLAIVGVVITFLATAFFIGNLKPRLVDEEPGAEESEESEPGSTDLNGVTIERLRKEISELETTYTTLLADPETPEEDSLGVLAEAIRKQENLLRNRTSTIASSQDLNKLEELKTLYDQQMGAQLSMEAEKLISSARAAHEAGNSSTAVEQLDDALQIYRQINEDHPRYESVGPVELQQLNRLRTEWVTEPLAAEVENSRKAALDLASQGNFSAAATEMQKAIEAQRTLNRDHRNSPHASLATLRSLESEARELAAGTLVAELDKAIADAEEAMEAANPDKAVEAAQRAMALQESLATRFSDSRRAGPAERQRIEELLTTAESLQFKIELEKLDAELRRRLRERETSELNALMATIVRTTDRIQREFSNGRFYDSERMERLIWLENNWQKIRPLQEAIDPHLKPIPGTQGLRLLDAEVHQTLYETIMGANPSLNQNPLGPVESLTGLEAVEFCRRLSWCLGRKVYLPTEEILKAAVGSPDFGRINAASWHAGREQSTPAPIRTSDANKEGFHDLLGNVAEWVSAELKENVPPVGTFGGSIRDNAIRLVTLPTDKRDATERNRFIGFRFVVDFTD